MAYILNVQKRSGATLPHWEAKNAIYFVTFRLAGSLPSSLSEEIILNRRDILETAQKLNRNLSAHELDELEELHFKELSALLLDKNAKYLSDNRISTMIAENIKFFDGIRYKLFAWCMMPNHVHVVLQPMGRWQLATILHTWKSFTAKRANTLLNLEGTFWQKESYDHLVRSEADLERCIEYTWNNPGKRSYQWRWKRNT